MSSANGRSRFRTRDPDPAVHAPKKDFYGTGELSLLDRLKAGQDMLTGLRMSIAMRRMHIATDKGVGE